LATDSLGCKRLRNDRLARQLIHKYGLLHKSKSKFLEVFQAPDERYKTSSEEVLTYYFGSICSGSSLAENADKCYASFKFKEDILIDANFDCE
jgi:hypothetical protein